jgi:hypothetical protein
MEVDLTSMLKTKDKDEAEDQRKHKTSFTEMVSEETTSEDSGLAVCYCVCCGSYAMVISTQLETLPKRRTDQSLVLDETKHLKKNTTKEGKQTMIKRAKGNERQYRQNCSTCGVFLAYRSTQRVAKYLYLLEGALTSNLEHLNEVRFGKQRPH